MKTITQLIVQFTCDSSEAAGEVVDRITHGINYEDLHRSRPIFKPSNILIKVEQTIHPEA